MALVGTLPERRLPEVLRDIEADYAELANGVELFQEAFEGSVLGTYGHKGQLEKYDWYELALTSHDLLAEDGLRVLDIGCGAGRVVRDYNARRPGVNIAYGITANAYGQEDPAIIVGNAHYLDDSYPADLGPIDRAVANLALVHFADPLSVFLGMAKNVKKGGLMVTDHFGIRAYEGTMVASHVLRYLVQSGHFNIVSKNANDVQRRYVDEPSIWDGYASYVMPGMVLERTSETDSPLDLPVSYDIDTESGKWYYFAA